MTGKVLQAIGLMAIVGLAGFAGVGLFVLRDRIRIVVQADAASEKPDPSQLLREEVQQLGRDVDALNQALADNLQKVGTALHGANEDASTRQAALFHELQVLREQSAGTLDRVRELDKTVRDLSKAVAERPQVPETSLPVSAPATPEPQAPTAEAPAAAPEKQTPATPEDPAATFLTFRLPARKFDFRSEQTFTVIADLSRVGFDAVSTLHDFSGVTSQVSGSFTANLADPKGLWRGSVRCAAAALRTGVADRDTNMFDNLGVKEHPDIVFELQSFAPAANGIDEAKQTVAGEVIGAMTIRGVRRDLRMPVHVSIDSARRAVIEGQAPLKLSDFSVPVPSQLGVLRMQDEVKVWIALRARVQAGSEHGK